MLKFLLVALLLIAPAAAVDMEDKLGPELGKSELHSDGKVKVFVKGDVDTSKYGNVVYDFQTFDGAVMEIPRSRIDELALDTKTEMIEVGKPVELFLSNSTSLINSTYTNNFVFAGENLTGKGVSVCVLDTGVDYTHPDLSGFGPDGKVINGTDVVNNDNDPMDDQGHGTHVAGIVAANGTIRGVAPGASIVAVKVLDSGGSGTTTEIAQGIDWCVQNADAYNITVITMSLGTRTLYSSHCDSSFPEFVSPLAAAVAKNITVIASSGNSGSSTGIGSPACMTNVTPVASTTKSDALSSFSNVNSLVELVAPGSSINSTLMGGGYGSKSGTSMASPHVAGALAILHQKYNLIYGAFPDASLPIDALVETGKPVSTLKRIDVYEASLRMDITPPSYLNHSSNATRYWVNDTIEFFSNWTDNLNGSLRHVMLYTNETGDWRVSNLTLLENGTANVTWFNGSLYPGSLIKWALAANDSAGNMNFTANETFYVHGWANASELTLPQNKTRGMTPLECGASDKNFTVGVSGFNISFYWNDTYIGSNTTNASGSAAYLWNTSALDIGWHGVTCSITNGTGFYNVTESNVTASFFLKGYPAVNITSPMNGTVYFVGDNVTFNSAFTQDNGSEISLTSVLWTNTSDSISSIENFTWEIPLNYSIGLNTFRLNASAGDMFDNGSASITIEIRGFAEIYGNSSVLAHAGSASTLSCSVRNNNTLSPVSGHNVSFYDGQSMIGSNTTNASGWASLSHAFSAGDHEVSCAIGDYGYYNASSNATWDVSIQSPPPAPSSGGSGSGNSGGGSASFSSPAPKPTPVQNETSNVTAPADDKSEEKEALNRTLGNLTEELASYRSYANQSDIHEAQSLIDGARRDIEEGDLESASRKIAELEGKLSRIQAFQIKTAQDASGANLFYELFGLAMMLGVAMFLFRRRFKRPFKV